MATATEAKPSAPTQAPSGRARPSGSSSARGNKYQFVTLDGLQNYLKLRTKLPITDQLSAEVGADYNVSRQDANPQAALFYEVSLLACSQALGYVLCTRSVLSINVMQIFRGEKRFATLRLSLDRLAIRKPFDLQREKFGCRLNCTAAATFDGEWQPAQLLEPYQAALQWPATAAGCTAFAALLCCCAWRCRANMYLLEVFCSTATSLLCKLPEGLACMHRQA